MFFTLNPNPDMLLRIAQADAYCLGVEYVDDPDVREEALKFERYIAHPRRPHTTLKAGNYSDDTQMSIAVTEVLLKDSHHYVQPRTSVHTLKELGGVKGVRMSFIRSFFDCFKRDPRDGYSRKFQKFLEKVQSPEQFAQDIVPNSEKNGAAMRAVPLGVLQNPYDVAYFARLQGAITHDTYAGMAAAQMVALMSHWTLYRVEFNSHALGCPHGELWDFLYAIMSQEGENSTQRAFNARFLESICYIPWSGPVKDMKFRDGYDVGLNTAWAVYTLIMHEKSLLGILKRTIEWGGDTDSVAAIAWGIASAYMKEELPGFFETGLEQGEFGVQYLKDLGSKLMDAFVVKE